MPTKDLETGTLFLDGIPFASIKDFKEDIESIDSPTSNESIIHQFNTEPIEFTFPLKNVSYDRKAILSLLYGRKVTNNWLKMHGGVMTRKSRKKIK